MKNLLITSAEIDANTSGKSYKLSFEISPAVYA